MSGEYDYDAIRVGDTVRYIGWGRWQLEGELMTVTSIEPRARESDPYVYVWARMRNGCRLRFKEYDLQIVSRGW